MSLHYELSNGGNSPTHEDTHLVIETYDKYSTAVRVLDAARQEFAAIQQEEKDQILDAIKSRFDRPLHQEPLG